MDPHTWLCKSRTTSTNIIQQLCEDTGCCPEDLPEAMNDREKWRERVRDIRATSTTWWWDYILQCMVVTISVGGFVADQIWYNWESAQYLWYNIIEKHTYGGRSYFPLLLLDSPAWTDAYNHKMFSILQSSNNELYLSVLEALITKWPVRC